MDNQHADDEAASDADSEMDDLEYSPMAVDDVDVLEPESSEDEGMGEILNLCSPEEMLAQHLDVLNLEILSIVNRLGGDTGRYRRERNRQVKHLVSDIYSGPHVTAALKLLPSF